MCFTKNKPWYTKLLGIKPMPKIALTDLYVIKILVNDYGQLIILCILISLITLTYF